MMVNDTLRKHLDNCAITYLNDILVYSKTYEEHVRHVKEVLRCLEEKLLRLKPEKCEFHKKEVDFLSFMVGVNGIRMDLAKIEAIKN